MKRGMTNSFSGLLEKGKREKEGEDEEGRESERDIYRYGERKGVKRERWRESEGERREREGEKGRERGRE